MKSHTVTYEQFCSVMGRNVIFEETHYLNGKKTVHCANNVLCAMNGGCRNEILQDRVPELKG
ncbi:MAG: hypothetical protein IJK23_06600 [Clostridia bacterium]|nr:hypothetical protein [Clostridia bacterium]